MWRPGESRKSLDQVAVAARVAESACAGVSEAQDFEEGPRTYLGGGGGWRRLEAA